jgi:DNA repair protein RecN (Recombination protein N)
MLRRLSIRNFAVVEALEVEFDSGFSVLTGETGAGKSILLDALSLLLGDRFEARQLRPGADRAEIVAEFDLADAAAARAYLLEQDLLEEEALLLRRTLDAQGRSRAWINGRPATLAQLASAGESLVDLHGQHAHESFGRAETQRLLLDSFGGFAALARETATAWRAWRDAADLRARSERDTAALASERAELVARHAELSALGATAAEWEELTAGQSRLAHAASLLEAATAGEAELSEGDAALRSRLAAVTQRLRQVAMHDRSLESLLALVDEARIRVDEAARALRAYRERLDLDPAELARIEERLGAIHATARKYRITPGALQGLAEETAARLAMLSAETDAAALSRAEASALSAYSALSRELSAKRRLAAAELAHRVTVSMESLAMSGGRFDVALSPEPGPKSHGLESVEFAVSTHPKQEPGPMAKVASGGELSRLALALQVVLADVGRVPTLIFDEVDVGIGGAVAASVGRSLRELGDRRQVLCVTHLPQVAACADRHYRVTKVSNRDRVATQLVPLEGTARVEELARMLGGREITTKTRAHAKELLAQNQRR